MTAYLIVQIALAFIGILLIGTRPDGYTITYTPFIRGFSIAFNAGFALWAILLLF